MKPTIGRIVLYRVHTRFWTADQDNVYLEPLIVTGVNEDGLVTGRVLSEDDDLNMSLVRHVREGTEQGQWRWPERV